MAIYATKSALKNIKQIKTNKNMNNENLPGGIKLAIYGVVALIVIWLAFAIFPFAQVESGEVGIVTNLGAYSRTMSPGLNWRTPFIENVTIMNVQETTHELAMETASKDLQTITTAVKINYRPDDQKIADIFVNVGLGFVEKKINPAIQAVARDITSKYTAEELVTKRPQVTAEILEALTLRLANDNILVTNVVTDIKFSQSYEEAIDRKVTAEQNALTEKNNLAAEEYKADQRAAQARGEAEAIAIQSKSIESQGGKNYLELKRIEVQLKLAEKWGGQLPTTMIPGGSTPLINFEALK